MTDSAKGQLSTDRALSRGRRAIPADLGRPAALGLAGGLVLLIFTVVALSGGPPSTLGELRVASFSYAAIVATLAGVMSWTVVLLYNCLTRAAARAGAIFGVFIVWAFGSLVIGGATRQGVQFLLVQGSFLGALFIAATARRVVGLRLDVMVVRCLQVTTTVLIVSAVLGAALNQHQLSGRATAIVSLICLSWFLADYRLGNRRAMWWSLATFLGIGLSLSRTALFAAFVLVVVTAFLVSERQRARSVVVCLLLLVAGYWAVTSWAPLRDRFSEGDVSLSVGGVNVNAEGRTKVWGVLWSEAQDELLIGRGPGAASARTVELDPAFDHPHNDFLRVLYDFGIVGLGLLTWFAIRTIRLLRRARRSARDAVPPLAALYAGVAILIVMATDNPLDYPFVMIPLGALLGLGLGVVVKQAREAHGASIPV